MSDRLCLIVDDEPAIRSFLSAILESEHFRTLEAGSAAEGLKIVQRLSGRIALILTDINMPGEMDGIDLASSIVDSFPSVPVILMSGYEKPALLNRTGALEFIPKPFTPEVIIAAVRRVLAAVERLGSAGHGGTTAA